MAAVQSPDNHFHPKRKEEQEISEIAELEEKKAQNFHWKPFVLRHEMFFECHCGNWNFKPDKIRIVSFFSKFEAGSCLFFCVLFRLACVYLDYFTGYSLPPINKVMEQFYSLKLGQEQQSMWFSWTRVKLCVVVWSTEHTLSKNYTAYRIKSYLLLILKNPYWIF